MDSYTIIGFGLLIAGFLITSFKLRFKFFKPLFFKFIAFLFGAVGVYLLTYNSSKIISEMHKDFNHFRYELDAVKENSTDSIEISRVIEISNKFDKWAVDFSKEKIFKEIDIEKKKLTVKQKNLSINKEYRAYYNHIFEGFKKTIEHYNTTSGDSIQYKFGVLPNNIFSNQFVRFKSYILTKEYLWRLSLCCKKLDSRLDFPSISIESYAINKVSNIDTISDISELIEVSKSNFWHKYESEFILLLSNNNYQEDWYIYQTFGNIQYEAFDNIGFNNSEFYNKIDDQIIFITENIVLN